jgi:hypothetical protein
MITDHRCNGSKRSEYDFAICPATKLLKLGDACLWVSSRAQARAAGLNFGEGGVALSDASKPGLFVARLWLCYLRFYYWY